MIKRRHLLTLMLSLSALALPGCETTTAPGAVGAQRQQLLLISAQQLDEMAAQSYNKLKADAAAQGKLNRDGAMLQRVRAIASRLTPQTRVFRTDAPGWRWEVNLITGNELNAYCMPGGKIMFYTGLVQRLSLSDDEIAAVMGHEISHALREHSREQVSQAIAAQAAIDVGTAVLGLGAGSADIAGMVYQSLIATRFSRSDESEADRMGLELMARAGYDPRAAVRLWQKMITAGSSWRHARVAEQPPDRQQPGATDRSPAASGHAALHGGAPKRLTCPLVIMHF